jgi:hypothetical protein
MRKRNGFHAEGAEEAEGEGEEGGVQGGISGCVVSGGMAPRPTRHEPAWVVGKGRGTEMRQDAIRVFWERDADRSMISEARRSRLIGHPTRDL